MASAHFVKIAGETSWRLLIKLKSCPELTQRTHLQQYLQPAVIFHEAEILTSLDN